MPSNMKRLSTKMLQILVPWKMGGSNSKMLQLRWNGSFHLQTLQEQQIQQKSKKEKQNNSGPLCKMIHMSRVIQMIVLQDSEWHLTLCLRIFKLKWCAAFRKWSSKNTKRWWKRQGWNHQIISLTLVPKAPGPRWVSGLGCQWSCFAWYENGHQDGKWYTVLECNRH